MRYRQVVTIVQAKLNLIKMMNIATVDRSNQNLELTLHYTLISTYYIHVLILAYDDNVGTSLSKLIDKVVNNV